jgi:hypothetical protein
LSFLKDSDDGVRNFLFDIGRPEPTFLFLRGSLCTKTMTFCKHSLKLKDCFNLSSGRSPSMLASAKRSRFKALSSLQKKEIQPVHDDYEKFSKTSEGWLKLLFILTIVFKSI